MVDIATTNYVDSQDATKAALVHTHTASQISDSTTVGRSIIVASTAADVRSAIALGNVDNTSDANKPVSTAQAAAMASFGRDRGSAGTLPNTDLRRGDVAYHTGWACGFMYNGLGWRQMHVPEVASITNRNILDSGASAAKHVGFQIMLTGLKTLMTWDGTAWRFFLSTDNAGASGPGYGTDGNGIITIAHGGGATPLAFGATRAESTSDAQNVVLGWLNFGKDSTNIVFRATRHDSSTYFSNPGLGLNWWARF